MARYVASKEVIDKILSSMPQKKRAEIIKSYTIIAPSNLVVIETTEDIKELEETQ